jgi:hypothetical protein
MVLYPNISAFLLSHRRPLPVLKSLQPSILQLVKRQQFLMKAALTQRFIALFLQISGQFIKSAQSLLLAVAWNKFISFKAQRIRPTTRNFEVGFIDIRTTTRPATVNEFLVNIKLHCLGTKSAFVVRILIYTVAANTCARYVVVEATQL